MEEEKVVSIQIDKLSLNPKNVRFPKDYELDHPKMIELVENIKINKQKGQGRLGSGIHMPLVVFEKEKDDGNYIVHMGNRRYIASKEAGLEALPCIISERPKNTTEDVLAQVAENMARKNPDPLARGKAYYEIKVSEGWSSSQIEIFTGDHDAGHCISAYEEQLKAQKAVGKKKVEDAVAKAKAELEHWATTSKVIFKRRKINPEDKITLTRLLCQKKASAIAAEVVAKQLQNDKSNRIHTDSEIGKMIDVAEETGEFVIMVKKETWNKYQGYYKTALEKGKTRSETFMLFIGEILEEAEKQGILKFE